MSVATILKQADIFFELTTTQLELIASIAEERNYHTGEVVFEEQSGGDELYVIANGEVNITIETGLPAEEGAVPYTVATLRRGQSFGEVALVDEGRRSATAVAAEHDTHLIVIPSDKLNLLCDTYPQLGYHLMRNLAADLAMKIRNTDLQVRDKLLWSRQHKN